MSLIYYYRHNSSRDLRSGTHNQGNKPETMDEWDLLVHSPGYFKAYIQLALLCSIEQLVWVGAVQSRHITSYINQQWRQTPFWHTHKSSWSGQYLYWKYSQMNKLCQVDIDAY